MELLIDFLALTVAPFILGIMIGWLQGVEYGTKHQKEIIELQESGNEKEILRG